MPTKLQNLTCEQRVVNLLEATFPKGLSTKEIDANLNIGLGIYSIINRAIKNKLIFAKDHPDDRRKTIYFAFKKSPKESVIGNPSQDVISNPSQENFTIFTAKRLHYSPGEFRDLRFYN